MGKRQHIKQPTIYLTRHAAKGYLVFVEPAPATAGSLSQQFDSRREALDYGHRLAQRFGWRFLFGDQYQRGVRG